MIPNINKNVLIWIDFWNSACVSREVDMNQVESPLNRVRQCDKFLSRLRHSTWTWAVSRHIQVLYWLIMILMTLMRWIILKRLILTTIHEKFDAPRGVRRREKKRNENWTEAMSGRSVKDYMILRLVWFCLWSSIYFWQHE